MKGGKTLIRLKYIDKTIKVHGFSLRYFCKTLIILMILISLSGYNLSCSTSPNQNKSENKESIETEKIMEKEETVDEENQIFIYTSDISVGRELGRIYLLTLSKDKKIIRKITNVEFDGEVDISEITPDGKKVLLTFSPATSRHQNLLYVMNIDGTAKINLTENMWGSHTFTISPDGKKVAFIGQRLGFPDSLYLINIDGSERVDLLEGMEEIKKGIEASPVFSPDGHKILFRAIRSESGVATSYLYLYDLDKKEIITLVKDTKGLIGTPSFLPDGEKVLFKFIAGYYYLDPGQLEIVNIDGTERKNITGDIGVISYNISHDGKKVAFIGQKSGYSPDFTDSINPSLCIVNTDGTEMKNLLKGMQIEGNIKKFSPVFSIDGQKILFIMEQQDLELLYTYDLDKNEIKLLIEAESISDCQFSPDGKKIILNASFKGDKIIYFIGIDNLTGKPIYDYDNGHRVYSHRIINDDGSPIMFISIEEIVLDSVDYITWLPLNGNISK